MTSVPQDKPPGGVTVLIVDDSRMARRVMASILEDLLPNASFVQAGNGREALTLMQGTAVDLVFLDLNMPEFDGFEFLAKAQEIGVTSKIVVASANYQVKAVERCMGLGALAFLKKPATPENIKKTLQDAGML